MCNIPNSVNYRSMIKVWFPFMYFCLPFSRFWGLSEGFKASCSSKGVFSFVVSFNILQTYIIANSSSVDLLSSVCQPALSYAL